MIKSTYAQDESLKNWRFGLQVTPSLNWFKPEGKIIENDGVAAKIGGGLVIEYSMAKIIALQTGLQINVGGGKLKYNNGDNLSAVNTNFVSYYYNNVDEEIVPYDTSLSRITHTEYLLNKRSFNTTYVTLPLALKMKTKEIGSLTYFGMFGINNNIRFKSKAKDDLNKIDPVNGLSVEETKSDIEITKDVSLFVASLNFGVGAEWNLSGTTALTFGLNYSLGFTSAVKDDSKYLERRAVDASGNMTYTPMPQQVNPNAFSLMVGVLF